ncbi:MAG: YARHG domain-containing protein [Prevotella sp.]|nr:YARHG domain-containing protein [Prevotella sp.]
MITKRLLLTFAAMMLMGGLSANDGVYYVSGNQLVSVEETDIAVAKEILTIEIGDDQFARVNVYYEFYNPGPAKTLTMGFEAMLPYEGSVCELNPKGVHPYIHDFTATINGKSTPYSTGVVAKRDSVPTDMRPLNMRKWHFGPGDGFQEEDGNTYWDMNESFLTNGTDTIDFASCAYYFKARFKEGKNIVVHSYRYRMSASVNYNYAIPYLLTPATRWANHQIDDFTLHITAPKGIRHFMLYNDGFLAAPFQLVSGKGKMRPRERVEEDFNRSDMLEVYMYNGTLEWKSRNFRPEHELFVFSGNFYGDAGGIGYDNNSFFQVDDSLYQAFYGKPAKNDKEKTDLEKRIRRNLPYAARGYVFNDKNLRAFFEKQWWYTPDPNWKMSTDDFTRYDWDMIESTTY